MAGNTLAVDQIVLHFWGGFLSFLKGEEKKSKVFCVHKEIKNDSILSHDLCFLMRYFPLCYFWLTRSLSTFENHKVNLNIFTLSSPAQEKMILPLVHYRHDTGLPHLPITTLSVPQEKVGM